MSRFAGCTRFVYNKGIAWNEEQRNADSNFKISYKALSAQLPIWKENHPWLANTYSQCLQQAMKDLSQGFQRFFAGDAGFPKFHKKFASTDSFRFPQNFKINEGNKQILLPGIGWWDEGTKNGPDKSALLGHNFVYQETKPHGFYSSYFHQRISS